jgi:acyl-CoA thioester hydrolase
LQGSATVAIAQRRAVALHVRYSPATVAAREEYPHALVIPTRWKDNDVYGHVNNVEYYSYFDTVINEYLISQGGLDIHAGGVIGVCAESHCEYHGPISFPESIDACLRIGKLGRSSARYEIGLFRQGEDDPVAVGWFVHVFVDRDNRRPVEIPEPLRGALARLVVSGE